MTKIVLEVELDLETHYRPGRPAKLTPHPGHPPESEEIEVVCIDYVTVEGHQIQLPNDTANTLLEELLGNHGLRTRIEEQIRDEVARGG